MSPSQQNKIAAYEWAVEVLEQARMKSRVTKGVERYVVRLQVELQGRVEKIAHNAEQRTVRNQRLQQVFAQMDDEDD